MSGRVRPKYATKAAFDRLVAMVRTVRPDVDKLAIQFSPDGAVSFLPVEAKPAEGADTWGDL